MRDVPAAKRARGDSRASQVRRYLTSAGFVGLESDGRTIFGVPGWRIVVTTQEDTRVRGKTIFARLLDLNRETRTVLVRTKMMQNRTPPPTIGDSQVLVRLEDYTELLAYRYEHERTCHT